MKIWSALATTLLLTSLGCGGHSGLLVYSVDSVVERPETYYGMPLESGQLVLSEAPGAYSFVFALGLERFFDFTHAAVLVMEDGAPYVYDMSGVLGWSVLFAECPTDAISGGCRRTPLTDYAAANWYTAVYDPPPGADGAKIAAWAQRMYDEQPDFDSYFNWKETSSLFCTQFVQEAVVAGGGEAVPLVKIRQHPGLRRTFEWCKVSTDFSIPAGLWADPKRLVAALGFFPSRRDASCYFAAKRELHRRFSDDQALGNVFVIDFGQLELRPEIDAFMNAATQLFPDSTTTEQVVIEREVQALAKTMFGEARPRRKAKRRARRRKR